MKTNFWKSAAAFVVGMAAMVACQKEQLTPVFPQEVITNSDVTTTSESITFTANLDWELSVPQETIAFFWLEDASGNKLNKLSGKAGEVTVKVGITDEPDFNNDITCNVTLKMGEESKVVATYTLLKSVKEFKAFADVITDGNLTWNTEEGGFLYEEQPTTEVTLVYNEIYGFTMPFTFEAGFNYDVDCPEWMVVTNNTVSETSVGKRGTCEVFVTADLEKLAAEVTTGNLNIKVRNSDEVVATIKVNLPSLADFVLCSKDAVNIGIDGKYLGELDACELTVQTTADLTFVLAGLDKDGCWTASTHSSYPYEAATLTVGDKTGEGLLKSQTVSVAFTANDGPARTAYLLAMPAEVVTAVEDGFNTFVNNAGPKEELPAVFAKYVLTVFTQEGEAVVEGEVLTFENAEWAVMEATNPWYSIVKNNFGQSVECFTAYAGSAFKIGSQVEIYGWQFFNGATMEEDSQLFTADFFDGKLTLSASVATSGLVLLQGAEGVFAAVYVEYTPSAAPIVEISFEMPDYVNGATLAKATSETFIQDVLHAGGSMDNTWVLTYTSAQPSMAMINVPCMPKWESAFNNADSSPTYWLTYEQMGETSIYVDMKEAGKTDFFLFEVGSTTYALICTYVAEAQGGGSAALEPTETLEFMMPYGDYATLSVLDSSNEICSAIQSVVNTQNIWHVVVNSQDLVFNFTGSIASFAVYTTDFEETTSVGPLPMGPNMFRIPQPTANPVDAIILIKNAAQDVIGVIYYQYSR